MHEHTFSFGATVWAQGFGLPLPCQPDTQRPSPLPPGEGAQTLTLRLALQGAIDFFRRNRQVADTHADGVSHGIGDRWRHRRERALTDAFDLIGTNAVG